MTGIFKLAASTALAGLVAAGAAAQGTEPGVEMNYIESPTVGDFYATDLLGADVVTPSVDEDGAEWDEIGSVGDVLVGEDGAVRAVLVDIGGFLGVGAKTVALPVASIDIGRETDDAPLRVAVDQSREALENAPAYADEDGDWALGDWSLEERAERAGESVSAAASSAGAALSDGADAVGDAVSDGADEVGDTMDRAAAGLDDNGDERMNDAEPTGVVSAPPAEEIEGADVRDSSDESVGTVAQVVNGPQGQVAVMDIGGVMGIGAHRIAMPIADLDVSRDMETNEVRVRVSATEDQLREMPPYEG